MLSAKLKLIYKFIFSNMHLFIIVLLIIFLIFFTILSNRGNKKNIEHYAGFMSYDFLHFLQEKNYKIDNEKKLILKCSPNDINNINNSCKEISYQYHFNTFDSIVLCNDKFETNKLLKKNSIPVPISFLVPINISLKNLESLLIVNKINYPIIIKDNNGTFGLNVYTNINNTAKAILTLKELSKVRNRALIEEQISGDCYRIFVFNKQIIDIVKREKPYIIGNGITTIKELINIRNKNQLELKLYPTNNINVDYINEQGYKIDSILESNKKIYITNIINFHNGAKVYRININTVSPKNLKMFSDICDILKIKCIGVDYLSDDINIDYDLNNGKILEINGTPDTEIHTLLNKDKDEVAKYFFKKIVDNI